MPLPKIHLGKLSISKFIIGGNPVSGISHFSLEKDDRMRHYFTSANTKAMLAEAERLGVNAHLARSDRHVTRYMMEYWDEGGKILWLSQTCPELGNIVRSVQDAINGKASAVHIHGGDMDNIVARRSRTLPRLFDKRLRDLKKAIKLAKDKGIPVGLAGHNTKVFEWAEKNLDMDYYMCCYYNPTDRSRRAEHVHGAQETYDDRDRQAMVQHIQSLKRPVIHYKILAAGRNDPRQAFEFAARHMRPQDAVCVGIFPGDFPKSLPEDLRYLEEGLAKAGKM